MYFIIKYDVFNKYMINVTHHYTCGCEKTFQFGQREVTLVANKGEHSIIYSKILPGKVACELSCTVGYKTRKSHIAKNRYNVKKCKDKKTNNGP